MKNRIFLWLSLLITLNIILHSCQNEDFLKTENSPQRNNANFFKHKSNSHAKIGVDYINILEAYNTETDFLSKMPDQKGMPIWEKMRVIDTETYTGLMIPLSYDNETMSSILFATLDDRNTIVGVQDYDNTLLKDIVYNESIDLKFREQLFYTFMFMDNKTFGNVLFTNVPKGIMDDLKYDKDNGRIWMKDFDEPTHAHSETAKMLYIENCGTYWSCKNHESWSNCDHCPACFTSSCSTTVIWIPDEQFPGTPTFPGGGGGGGGGTPGSGGIPPKDPCALNENVFYRLAPGCNGGVGIPDIDLFDNPCKKAKVSIDKANEILKNTDVKQKMDVQLKGKITASNEWAVAIGQKPDNSYEVTSAIEQNATSGSIPSNLLTSLYIADGHSHAGNRGNPSGGDLFKFISGIKNNFPDLKVRYVYGNYNGTPEIYALVINDKDLAFDFLTQFPESDNYNSSSHDIKEDSPLGEAFYKARDYYHMGRSDNSSGEDYEARAVAMAYILEKYNAGISIAKVDADGNLKKINATIEQITVPYSGGAKKEGIKVSKCP